MYLGGLPFLALMAVLTTLAEIEFSILLSRRGFFAIHLFGLGLVWLCLLDGQFPQWGLMSRGLPVLLIVSFSWQVLRKKRTGVETWAGAIASGLYVGLSGASLVRLRALPGDGLWWTFTAIPVALFADAAAYLIGSKWGRRKLAPRLSPGKTWEGYLGGVVLGTLMGALLGSIWALGAGPGSEITLHRGLVMGLLVAVLAPLGDLTVSMVKREAGVKDTGRLLPAHGGALDRMDSVLFAAVVGYAYVSWFVG
jgi:phosphatidate cytidylyltransferase